MRNINQFPIQKLPMSKKTKDWREACVDYIIGKSMGGSRNGNNRTRKEEMQTYYDLYNSIYNEKDLKYVTNPFKQQDGFPAMAQDFNVVKPKIDLLLGEETKRPFNFKTIRTSDIATSEMQEKAKQMLIDYIQATIMSKLGPEEQARYQQALQSGEIMPPEQIQKYMSKDYKDVAEITAYHTLNYLKSKLNITHEFYKGWKDALVGGEEIYYIGIQNGNPCLERINPLYFDYDTDTSDLEFIHDAQWCVYEMKLSVTDIYDRFYDKLSEKQLNQLLDMADGTSKGGINPEVRRTSLDFPHIKTHTIGGQSNPFESTNSISVWHCCWQSFRKIAFVTIQDPETGEPVEYIVDESYNETGTEISVEWKWIIETWEGYRAGEDLYWGIEPLEYQYVSSENPNAQRLPYTGVIYNNTNSKPRSLVSIMKPLQYMYIVLWYRLELAMARDKGKVVNMDITQIPKSMNIDVSKWMHYLSALGVNFINPYECFSPDTLVMMGDGYLRKIKDIQIGEYVMGPDGNPRKVLAKHNGIDNMYRINVYTGGQDQIVNSNHKIYYKQKDYYHKTDKELLATPIELINSNNSNNYLQRTNKVDNNWNRQLLLDPYVLGLWLGDGCTNKTEFISEDIEVISYLTNFAENNGMVARLKNISGNNAINIRLANLSNTSSSNTYVSKNILKEALRYYGILSNKDIPDDYIYTTRENRLQLLAGLIDTDGHFSKRDNYYTFSQCESRKHIVDKFAFIARSLGFKCTISHYKGKDRKLCKNSYYSKCEDTWTVRILDGDLIIPTKIKRKQGCVKNKKGNALQSNFKVTYEGIGEYVGITVDNDNLFVLGDFTIVHNCEWVDGKDPTKPSPYNQITSIDLTMANTINQYIMLMDKIEAMLSEITGVSKQREGSISSNELVGNVERSVVQSAHITEPWFWTHNQVKKEALQMLLNTAKYAWKDNKVNINYVLDDATRAFLTLSDDFLYEDMDVFVEDTTKNQQQIEALKNLMQPAMQNGASLLDIAEIITMDNVTMIKNRLEEIEQKRMEQQQAMEQAQAEREQQTLQMQNEIKEEELMIKEAEMDLKKYEIDQNNATKITVAQLNAYRGLEDQDQNDNGIPDTMEIAAQALEERKQASEEASKQFEFNAKMREQQLKKEIEDKKVELEKQKLQAQMELQKQKDKAAMEREKLKARTALKNKTTGEK